jgi:hypothetical protein
MAERYFTEELTALEFHTLHKCLAAAAPEPLAWGLAAWFRLRGKLRWPLKPTYGAGDLDSGQIVSRDALPARALSRWAPIIEQLGDLGFSPLEYKIADTIGEKQNTVALLLDEPGSVIATLSWIRMRAGDSAIEKAPVEFNSYALSDPEIMTACVTTEELPLADMLQLPFVDPLVLSDTVRLAEIYRRHVARTAGRSCYQMSPGQASQEHRRRSERRFQWTLEKGLLRPLSPAEIAHVRTLRLE